MRSVHLWSAMTSCTILHLSDIHRTEDEPATNAEILNSLKGDFDRYSDDEISRPNFVVVTGDLTQFAEVSEYLEAATFLRQILEALHLPPSRLIVLPGNHDVHWPTCEESMLLRRTPPANLSKDLSYRYANDYLCARDEMAYQRRLDNFREFYKAFFSQAYPEARSDQVTCHSFPEFGVSFAAFNSCDLIDHHRFRGSIHPGAILKAADTLQDAEGIRIAAWHHDLDWRSEGCQDTLGTDTLRQLSERTFDLGICGHTHRPATHDVNNIGGQPLPVIAAGSLCAGPRQRPESVPRAYNVLTISTDSAQVFVRVKRERTTPWEANPFREAATKNFRPFYTVPLRGRDGVPPGRPSLAGSSLPPSPTTAKAPSPFCAFNARGMARKQVLSEYVWTHLAGAVDVDDPQIVLAPRGAGKTALLLTLTIDGRLTSRRLTKPVDPLRRIGLLCSMNIGELTSFNSKGWLGRPERAEAFSAVLATIWAQELVNALLRCESLAADQHLPYPSQQDLSVLLEKAWLRNSSGVSNLREVKEYLRSLRADIMSAISLIDDRERQDAFRLFMNQPLCSATTATLADVTSDLTNWGIFQDTHWILLFDEAEYLADWQQEIVYRLLGQASPRVSAKVATLPYAHVQAIRKGRPHLVRGNDYQELPISLNSDTSSSLEFGTGGFESVATALWDQRLLALGGGSLGLSEAWPEISYEDVVLAAFRDARVSLPCATSSATRQWLEDRLIDQLPLAARKRALTLRQTSNASFSDQYWRKYSQAFRVRFATQVQGNGVAIPLAWGWRTLLRACEGNCRWFLQLADECWRQFWHQCGLRPLTAFEQYSALRNWSNSIYAVAGCLTEHGPTLKEIIDRISSDLRSRIVGSQYLKQDALVAKAARLHKVQAEAVAVGVAYGLVVPRFKLKDSSISYPVRDVALRLGFPICLALGLPLREGDTVRIPSLEQVTFPWLNA